MLGKAVFLLFLSAAVNGLGEFSILYNPDSLEFKGNDDLDTALLSDVVLSSLGHSVQSDEKWDGLYIRNPFKLPQNAVVFVIDGVEGLQSDALKAHTYPLSGDAYDLNSLTGRVSESVLLNLDDNKEAVSQISDIFGEIKPVAKKVTSSLKPGVNVEDKDFFNKVAIIEALSEKLEQSNAVPSLIVVRMSMAAFRQAHADSPVANSEATDFLADAIARLSAAAQKSFDGNLLVASVATAEHLLRHRRETTENVAVSEAVLVNLAKTYGTTYPVIFNIILWFGVVFFFSLLAICLAIAYMDPGRDSIIYRMTSTRMKKEN